MLLNYYDDSPPNPQAETVVYQRGCKNTAIRRLLELRPDLLMQYDRVLFLDDDIEITAAQIDLLFQIAEREKLDLAGPSLTPDSQTAWPFLKQPGAGKGIMRVSSIEIMAPLITRRALEAVAWVFAESPAAGEATCCWGRSCAPRSARRASAWLAPVAVRHARPVDTKGGTLYLYLRSYGIETGHEANRIAFDFGVDRFLRPLSPGETGPVCRDPRPAANIPSPNRLGDFSPFFHAADWVRPWRNVADLRRIFDEQSAELLSLRPVAGASLISSTRLSPFQCRGKRQGQAP